MHDALQSEFLNNLYLANPVTLAVLAFQRGIWVAGADAPQPTDLGLRILVAIAIGLPLLWICQRVFARFGRPPVQLVPLVLDHNLRNTRQIAQTFVPLAPPLQPLAANGALATSTRDSLPPLATSSFLPFLPFQAPFKTSFSC